MPQKQNTHFIQKNDEKLCYCNKNNYLRILFQNERLYFLSPYFFKSYCVSLGVILCTFLITVITVRRHSPIKAFNETHSVLLVFYLSAAADIVDFAEYSKYEILIKGHGGVNLIWSLFPLSVKFI